jgi:two-component system sensor histidine kinase KdpD
MSDQRPDPDVLLAEVKRQETKAARGNLKVFFGAAAGVGKTYAMLEEARARAAEGVDVVVGYAEPHARTETEALLLGMELLPYHFVEYKGARLKEFDLDAALHRKPALILVDELAHTNPPGLRHAKRWQDVMELLDAGINVYTTLNVQHLESINDIVQRITGVAVRETLPDSVLEQADDVELIDTSPDELLERLAEGKIYRPDVAERATKHFFNKGNLIALREMALRRTAERVDAQMLDFRQGQNVREPWAASERILVCVGPSPLSARLVRATKRLADGLKAKWLAAHVETPSAVSLSPQDRDRITQTLRLAQQLGAEVITLAGTRIAEEVVNYARTHNVTKIVIGKPDRAGWRQLFRRSVVDEIVDASGQIDIYVIRGEAAEDGPSAAPLPRPRTPRKDYFWAVATVALSTALGWPFYHGLGPPGPQSGHYDLSDTNILMLYLLGVLWVATRHGRGPAILASLLGVAAFDFCFVVPYLTFAVADTQYLVTFAVMLLTALTISTLTDRVRRQAEFARQRERRTAALFELSRRLTVSQNVEDIFQATLAQVGGVFEGDLAILIPSENFALVVRAKTGQRFADGPKESAVAQWVYEHRQTAGVDTATLPAAQGLYLPLVASRGIVGVLGIRPAAATNLGDLEQLRLLESFANQAALAIERANLANEARQAWERVEAEFMRNTLLSSVSHDLRTPLAAITGAASSLIQDQTLLSTQARRALAETIVDESERMERIINNLLDMTRLESGGLALKKEWQPLQEVVGAALQHVGKRLGTREVKTNLPADLPMVPLDAVAIEQVLVNLLDNAAQYTPADSPIEISARHGDEQTVVEVADRGPGLPAGTEQRVFQKFFRAHGMGSRRGIGLGLAICKGLVEAHGGRITATNRAGGGAVFSFALPIEGAPPRVDSND